MFFQAKLSYLRKHPLILLHAGCLITFTVQMIVLAMNQISPSTTISHLEERSLDSIDFPVLFKICIKPAFHTSELYKAGYENIWHYFLGQSRYNKSVFGWGGHTDNGSIIGTAGGKGDELGCENKLFLCCLYNFVFQNFFVQCHKKEINRYRAHIAGYYLSSPA